MGVKLTDVTDLWTIGHSTRPIDVFVALLSAHGIEAIADVRRHPGSRRQPQYQPDALQESLRQAQVEYHWMSALGGRRKATAIGHATAWKNASFQGYAEYIDTDEFVEGLRQLLAIAATKRTAIMCAEALWWRCHRRLIADVLVTSGNAVWDIMDRGAEPHRLIEPAHLVDGRLSYLPDDSAR